jgi:eukaryotic-like serine/threonine-protein kinase
MYPQSLLSNFNLLGLIRMHLGCVHTNKLLELSTNSSILAGKPAYTLIGTYQDPSAGLQKLMEIGTIIGDKAYSVQYIADAPRYTDYLPTVQKMIDSLAIKKLSSSINKDKFYLAIIK